MQLKSLEIFLTVVELGSFSLAANKLFTVQSNITSHIKKLESELNTELLNRKTPVRTTRAGEQLLTYARKILSLHDEVKSIFIEEKPYPSHPIQIGSMETTAAVHLPQILNRFSASFPALSFSLQTAPSRTLIEAVQNAQLDCAFIASPEPVHGLYNLHLFTEQLVVVTSKNTIQPLTATTLQQQKFLAFRQGCSYRRVIDLFLQSRQLAVCHIIEMGSLDGIMSCVSMNMGMAILPRSYVEQSHFRNAVDVLEIHEPFATMNTYLIADQPACWSSNLKHLVKQLTASKDEVVQI